MSDWIPMEHSEPYHVCCARCGQRGMSDEWILEEGDEWKCPPCNERENERERAEAEA
jgi:DNA-directed RNA polymerase subunit RPC12/RpoP